MYVINIKINSIHTNGLYSHFHLYLLHGKINRSKQIELNITKPTIRVKMYRFEHDNVDYIANLPVDVPVSRIKNGVWVWIPSDYENVYTTLRWSQEFLVENNFIL